jgi:hypothetical protein
VFTSEELVRRFNEANHEKADEHWTPRDAVRLMANLIFQSSEARYLCARLHERYGNDHRILHPYYRTTGLSEETDPNKLHDLKNDLDNSSLGLLSWRGHQPGTDCNESA